MTNVMIWKTCRVLANDSRLKILKRLTRGAELCVTDIAEIEHLSLVAASQHLRLLHEHGFLKQTRKSKWMFYSSIDEPEQPVAQAVISSLRKQLTSSPTQSLIKLTTAFTHPRRVNIIKQLCIAPRTFIELASVCDISPRALTRHIEKLVSRNLVQLESDRYRLFPGGTELAIALTDLCKEAR